jgi:DNA-binding IclR family transcriptional regulator
LYASSSGKLLLSELSFDQRYALLGENPYRSYTEHTITDPEALAAELTAVKRNGYATNVNEHMLGITSIGAPIYSLSGRHLGSIALSGVNAFFPAETAEGIITDLKQAAYLFSVASPAMRAVARFLGK